MVLKRTRFLVIVVAHFRPNDDRLARLERQSRSYHSVKTLEACALSLSVVEKLQPRRAAHARSEVVRQVVEYAEPIGLADVGHVGRETIKALEIVAQHSVELVRVDQIKDFRVMKIPGLVEAAGADDEGKQHRIPATGLDPLDAPHA